MTEEELEKLGEAARQNHVPVMMEDGLDSLLAYIRSHPRIQSILEIGTAVGYSAMNMASVRPDITVDTLEIDAQMAAQAEANIAAAGLADRVHVHLTDALEYRTEQVYDLIFVDAAKSQYRRYLEHFFANSRRGTVFVFDNLCFHGIVDHPELTHNRSTRQMTAKIRNFRNWLMVEPRFAVEYHADVGDGIAFARRVR